MTVDELIRILQGSVGPVVLISGVALLLLSLTNRLGRLTDRIRLLCQDIKRNSHGDIAYIRNQIELLYSRCKVLRMSIILGITSIVCVSLVIVGLFFIYVFHVEFFHLVKLLFSLSLFSLISSLLLFLKDIFMSLHSLRIEIDETLKTVDKGK